MTVIYKVQGRETVSSVSSSTGLTAAKLPPTVPGITYAIIQAVDGDVRYTIDGTTPTSSLGMRLLQDEIIEVWGATALANFRAIDDGATAKLEVLYMGTGV